MRSTLIQKCSDLVFSRSLLVFSCSLSVGEKTKRTWLSRTVDGLLPSDYKGKAKILRFIEITSCALYHQVFQLLTLSEAS